MKHPLLSVFVSAALVSVVVTALCVSLFVPRGARPAEVAAGPERAAPDADAEELVRRVAALERENEELRLRLSTLESRPAPRASEREPLASSIEPVSASTRTALETELRSTAEGQALDPEVFQARVDEALQRIREREEEQRIQEREQARAERIENRLAQLEEDLGLSPYQVDEMRTFLTDQEKRRAELWQSLGDGTGDRTTIREGMRALREESDATLTTILDPGQLEAYREQSSGFRFGGRGGGSRGRGR
ncbi:MAG TPA: hypothetical protein ENJ09_00890 [Planctomycetes bacterium]|nr:hypothetical protein [Planctomycetota bacterium]